MKGQHWLQTQHDFSKWKTKLYIWWWCLPTIKKKVMQTLFDPHTLLTDSLAGLHCGVSIINLSPLPLRTSREGLRDLLSKSKKKCAALWSMSLVSTLMRLPMPANLKIKMATSFSSSKKVFKQRPGIRQRLACS